MSVKHREITMDDAREIVHRVRGYSRPIVEGEADAEPDPVQDDMPF